MPCILDQERIVEMFCWLRESLANFKGHKIRSQNLLKTLNNHMLMADKEIGYV